jgi:hypothetical protein
MDNKIKKVNILISQMDSSSFIIFCLKNKENMIFEIQQQTIIF